MVELSTFDPKVGRDYRTVLGRVPTSVAVITSMSEDRPVGVAVGSFTSVSMEPPLVSFYIAASSTTWPLIEPSGGFCTNVLAAEQEGLCRTFATRGADKFSASSWRPSPAGRPVLDGVVAWLDCDIDRVEPAGDHFLVLGRVTSMAANPDGEPLVFLGGRYGRMAAHEGSNGGWA